MFNKFILFGCPRFVHFPLLVCPRLTFGYGSKFLIFCIFCNDNNNNNSSSNNKNDENSIKINNNDLFTIMTKRSCSV